MAYCEKCRFEFRFRHSEEECERAIADRAKEKAYFDAKREEAEKGLAEKFEKERHEAMVRRFWSENDRSNRRDPLGNTSCLAPPSAYQRPSGAKGVMTNYIAEVIAPAPFCSRWTVVFDLGPESCGVNADGSDPSWTPGQDGRDPGRGTVQPWMLDIVRRAEIPEPARAALLAAAE